ncbi:MAG TPA: hypothetical protein VM367_00200 [Pseudonocardia sp.]|nr:hypothetical protein [Pseudonocardia sp.]
MHALALLPGRHLLRRLDLLAAVTLVVFLALGVLAGLALARLAQLGPALADVAGSLDLTARAIALVGEVPVVGESADRLSGSVAQAAGSVAASATEVEQGWWTLAGAVGIAIALLPIAAAGRGVPAAAPRPPP